MKHLNKLFSATLSILIISACTNKKDVNENKTNTTKEPQQVQLSEPSANESFPIAYVNVDSLLTNYLYAKELNEELIKKQDKSRNAMQTKELQLRSEYAEYQKLIATYQEKLQTGQILTQETKEKEEAVIRQRQSVIEKKENELKELDRRLTQDLLADQQKLNSQLRDSINAFFAVYNKDKKYKMILCNTDKDNILYAEEELNITEDVIRELNKRYKPKSK